MTERLVELFMQSKTPHPPQSDEIVITGAVRTPTTKARRGGLKNLKADELLAEVLKGKDCSDDVYQKFYSLNTFAPLF
jgi:hypothetical protein